jgi:hypothetical protein
MPLFLLQGWIPVRQNEVWDNSMIYDHPKVVNKENWESGTLAKKRWGEGTAEF